MKCSLLVVSCFSAFCALVDADGMYTKTSPVLQVTSKDFSSLIEQSNHTSIVEFYAPWCGHCQNLKPAYEKAAKSLAGLAKVAAIDCDEESNKPLCGRMGVQGFPTLKIVKPTAKRGKPVIEDYQGARSAKAIVDAVIDKLPNHVKRIQDAGLDAWLQDGIHAKAMLFTEKGTTAPLIKALAVDFLGTIDFAVVRNKEKAAVEKFAVTEFPTIVLLSGDQETPAIYNGEMKKDALIEFFSQVATPNPDPAPKKPKMSSSKKAKATSSSASVSESASASSKRPAGGSKAKDLPKFDENMEAHTIQLDENTPLESPLPIVEHDEKPMVIKEAAPPIPELTSATELGTACLTPKSGSCILVLLPERDSTNAVHPLAAEALASFAEVAEKYHKLQTNILPFYAIPAENKAGSAIRQKLGVDQGSGLEIVAISVKRKWWRQYPATGYDMADAENFVDAIRLGEGAKQKLPADFDSVMGAVGDEQIALNVNAKSDSEDLDVDGSVTGDPASASAAADPVHNEL